MAAKKVFAPKKKKPSLKTILGIVISGIALLGLVSAAILANMNQDNRQQAASTARPVNCQAAGGRCVKDRCGNGFIQTDGKCSGKRQVCCQQPSFPSPYPSGSAYPSSTPYPSSSIYPTSYPYPSSSVYPSSYPYPSSTPYPQPSSSIYPSPWPASPMPTATARPVRPIGSPEPRPSGGNYLD